MPDESRSNKTAAAGDQNATRRDCAIGLNRLVSPHRLNLSGLDALRARHLFMDYLAALD
jgi:hypothetical protein